MDMNMKRESLTLKQQPRVVVVDDEPIAVLDFQEMLRSNGFDVAGTASDGLDALRLCTELNPDLILMDVKMPYMSGLSVARKLRENGVASCIVLLTSYSDTDLITEAKEIEIDAYLVKPVSEQNLIPAIEVALARFRERMKLRAELGETIDRLQTRQQVEVAKGLLMEKCGLTEHEAYNYIRELSRVKRMSMKEIAAIISQDFALNGEARVIHSAPQTENAHESD